MKVITKEDLEIVLQRNLPDKTLITKDDLEKILTDYGDDCYIIDGVLRKLHINMEMGRIRRENEVGI